MQSCGRSEVDGKGPLPCICVLSVKVSDCPRPQSAHADLSTRQLSSSAYSARAPRQGLRVALFYLALISRLHCAMGSAQEEQSLGPFFLSFFWIVIVRGLGRSQALPF